MIGGARNSRGELGRKVLQSCLISKSPAQTQAILLKASEAPLILSKFLLLFFLKEVYMYSGKNAMGKGHWACTKNERRKDTVGHRWILMTCSFTQNLLKTYCEFDNMGVNQK